MTISAAVIADSITEEGVRLTTMQLRYPRFIHAEFMTHRVFSRNASSSRAIPVERLIEDVRRDPAMPIHWGKNEPGMQAREECQEMILLGKRETEEDHYGPWVGPETAWLHARDVAIQYAEAFSKAGYHKQIVNRLLEPFSHINVLVTATAWDNFFALRRHEDAQPEIKALADAMWTAMRESDPDQLGLGQWHLPYVDAWNVDWDDVTSVNNAIKCSVARCARVSYLTHEGKAPSVEEDLKLYERLISSRPMHASPAEHQATPDLAWWTPHLGLVFDTPRLHGNFRGFIQYRKTIE